MTLLILSYLFLTVVLADICTWTVTLTADDYVRTLVIGNNQYTANSLPNWADWTRTDTVTAQGSFFAVEAQQDVGGPALITLRAVAVNYSSVIHGTTSAWRCTKIFRADWNQPTYNTSGWTNAVAWAGSANVINGMGSTQQIWATNALTTFPPSNERVWCRSPTLPRCQRCGDGDLDSPEGCDDNNRVPGDGCSTSCTIETGWRCPGEKMPCTPICGDGRRVGSELCDDANTRPNDGCSASCIIEDGWVCPTTASPCTPLCGDRKIVGTEQCDFGDLNGGDGCSPTCQIESGWYCTGNSCTTRCGDRIRAGREQCDDGNTISGDGCSNCTIEVGWQCEGSACTRAPPNCGDKVLQSNEQCDDGNTVSQDGCSGSCRLEPGWTCPMSGSPCVETCGDSIRVGREVCDDGNRRGGDGCGPQCLTIEIGWRCPPQGACTPVCGNGLVHGNETCDDRNLNNGDGCSASCIREVGFTCNNTASPSLCNAICGDGLVRGRETCDDNNTRNGDGCNSCSLVAGWYCNVPGQPCQRWCSNGVVDVNNFVRETCDDRNLIIGDGCSARCIVEPGWNCSVSTTSTTSICKPICGDYRLVGSESCEDGNTESGDGCSSSCQVEPNWVCPIYGLCCNNNTLPGSFELAVNTSIGCIDGTWALFRLGGTSGRSLEAVSEFTLSEVNALLAEELHICGHVSLEGNLVLSAPLYVYGTFTLVSGSLTFLDGGALIVDVPCAGIAGFSNQTYPTSLTVSAGTAVVFYNFTWTGEEKIEEGEFPTKVGIILSGCGNFSDGATIGLHAPRLPTGRNYYPWLITASNCIGASTDESGYWTNKLEMDLDGGCSEFRVITQVIPNEDPDLDPKDVPPPTVIASLEINYRHLCAGQIAGIFFGVLGFVLLLLIVAVVAMGGGGGGGGDDYTSF